VDLAEGSGGVSTEFLDARLIADIEFERCGAAAERFNFAFEFGERVDFAAGEDEIGAGFGESTREMLAEAAAGAGDDGDLAGEIEEFFTWNGVWHFSTRRAATHLFRE
jgi:hypothetical protein